MVGIPTGPPKSYALLHMFASLADLDWPDKELHWAVTTYDLPSHIQDKKDSDQFNQKIDAINKAADLPFPSTIHHVKVTLNQLCQAYRVIVENRNFLRQKFLESDCDYFLAVDGDVTPPRETIKHLMRHNVDLAFGVCYQRPGLTGVHPLVWVPMWTLDQLPPDLPEQIMKDFRRAFIYAGLCLPFWYTRNWRRKKKLTAFGSGFGCGLIKRHVLEKVRFKVPGEFQHHSEDLNFFFQCMVRGFSMVCDLKFVVPHLHRHGLAPQHSPALTETQKIVGGTVYPKLPPVPPPPITCQICGKPKQRIRVNDYVVFSVHLNMDEYWACRELAMQEYSVPDTLGFATTFLKPINRSLENMVAAQVKPK